MAAGPVLRLIDANANRAREALRVLEDYVRFVLGDSPLTDSLKSLRHDLSAALAPVLQDALLHRDTVGDVGTSITTPAEYHRHDLPHVITANAKRLGEALRSLEEYLKIDHPASAQQLEQVRYRAYSAEQQLQLTLRPHHARLDSARLYVLITESACRRPWQEVARSAIAGGADILQFREKDLDGAEFLRRARWLTDLCRERGVLSIINDRLDIALLADADGVHLGQGDLPAAQARKVLGHGKLLGVSTHAPEHAHRARLDSADYIGAGPVFKSPTKPRDIEPGLPYLESLRGFPLPAFAIAGITRNNLPSVIQTGCNRVAVTSAVTASDDPEEACRRLRQILTQASIPDRHSS
jgi:thiamine-phosphate pyrophosphorylase